MDFSHHFSLKKYFVQNFHLHPYGAQLYIINGGDWRAVSKVSKDVWLTDHKQTEAPNYKEANKGKACRPWVQIVITLQPY